MPMSISIDLISALTGRVRGRSRFGPGDLADRMRLT